MRPSRGFTLIELMVAIAIMALLALMSWRGLDGMARAQAQNRERGDTVLTLQTTLTQWNTDLDATVALAQVRAIDWDGRVLRLTRRSTDNATPMVYVVAWTLRADAAVGARWHRWQSPGVTSRPDWQQAWDQAAAWGQDGNAQAQGADVSLMPVAAWQLYYFRNGSWSPAVGADELGAATPEPDGIRLVLSLPPGPALAGMLTKDWVRPSATAPKS
ncbi:PulJ/GspJ family protein [Variovorax sp. PBL-E5]|uniref:PulJ/GspJ family protein n=1 Tax=Variovorax sp. PBL-E5 TaxID=434014 RepID=UPI001319B159|nr:prepilin-type N-terminal cleavage/methylation domain-containing protein [Variovorax sp. PBL-E5]VTU20630.1 type II secretion system protein J [Variovorax sp. PBL-E5]